MTTKQRTGITTGWLIFMLVINILSALLYLFKQNLVASDFHNGIPAFMLFFLAILSLINILFIVLVFKWIKKGVWGLIVTNILAVVINIYNGLGIGQSLLGLLGIVVLLLILQVKKNNHSNWSNLT
ncbi:hypothetical protein [Psychroserpens jangbogonensis]|uniref:hypothetical protein n=1 Tax=Psychroserpens jangbogonensis TaxID=1484460 RepID=UPI00053DCDCE|nr:hypothetical protein [Psychroserpens jangbogonensis]